MKIAVVGSRNFLNTKYVEYVLNHTEKIFGDFVLVSGGANGADTLAERWAIRNKHECEIYPANWEDLTHPDAKIKTDKKGRKYDAAAGFRRNKQIVEAADIVIAFWDGQSRGTLNTIMLAKKQKKKVYIFYPPEINKSPTQV